MEFKVDGTHSTASTTHSHKATYTFHEGPAAGLSVHPGWASRP